MADWFKFYADFFDHPRFQYAIHQLPEVCPVTVLILTEHCRHRSDTISWSGDEVDLLGFSAKINVSAAKINEAVKLLEKIRFIEVSGGAIKFLKWNDLQSEYCRKVKRNKEKLSGHSPDMSGQCPPRGEERRVDKKRNKKATVSDENKEFTTFYELYPRKHAKPSAVKAWRAIPDIELEAPKIMAAVRASLNSPEWSKNKGQYIPLPATWLNQRRWEDKPVELVQPLFSQSGNF